MIYPLALQMINPAIPLGGAISQIPRSANRSGAGSHSQRFPDCGCFRLIQIHPCIDRGYHRPPGRTAGLPESDPSP